MEGWQGRRMERAQEQDISVTHVDMTDDSFIFHVQGVSGGYMIEIYEDVTLWPPTCDYCSKIDNDVPSLEDLETA